MELTLEIIAKIGGVAALIGALSAFLANIWAGRIMRKEQQKIDAFLARNQSELDELISKKLRHHEDKLKCYAKAVELVATLAADIDDVALKQQPASAIGELFSRFNRGRFNAWGQMALVAPQQVMDSFDRLAEYVISTMQSPGAYDFKILRNHAVVWLNAVREDMGVNSVPIDYQGHL